MYEEDPGDEVVWSDVFEFEVMYLNLKWWIWIWSDEFEFEVMNLNLKWWIWIWSKEFEFDIWFIIDVALVGHRTLYIVVEIFIVITTIIRLLLSLCEI